MSDGWPDGQQRTVSDHNSLPSTQCSGELKTVESSLRKTKKKEITIENLEIVKYNQRTDSPESCLEANGLKVFTLFCSNLLKAFKIQNNLTIRQY